MLLLMMTLLYLSPSLFFKEHFKNLILNFFFFIFYFIFIKRPCLYAGAGSRVIVFKFNWFHT